MSTTTSLEETQVATPADAAAAAAEAAPSVPRLGDPALRTFRGGTLEELLPQIREQLGPDAIVVRQRDGLMGGIGGFFQQRFVEVEATAGHARVDVYDEQPAPTPESFAALLADAEAHADPIVTAAFAPPVGDSEPVTPPPAAAEPAAAAPVAAKSFPAEPPAAAARAANALAANTPAASRPAAPATDSLAAELTRAGMSASFADRLIADAEAHELPFAHGDLREAVRRALARRVPTPLPHRAGGLAIGFAGPGSTGCADALVSAYAAAGRRARAVASLEQACARIERGNPDALVALDLPPIPSDPAKVAALARRLRAVQLDELLMALPAGLDLPSARALHERLAPLEPTGLALVAEDARAPLGAALELACATRLPLAYALDHAGAIAPADPAALAERLLP